MLHCEASAKHQHLINNEEDSPEHFMIFPNPTSEEARIEFNIPFESYVNIYLTNPLGQVVNNYESRIMLERGLHYQDLNLRGLKAGIYTVKVITAGWMESKNLVLIKN
jgi:serine protease AprX